MRLPFPARLAYLEGRSGFRRLGWFVGTVAMGVAALVALYGFQRDAGASAERQARELLGGDLRFESESPFGERVDAILDSLRMAGATVARGTSLASVVSGSAEGRARLFQVNAVGPGFPVAGEVTAAPEGAWDRMSEGGAVMADPQVLLQLGVAPGDSVRIGARWLEVRGSASGLPTDFGVEWISGPPIYMALSDLPTTQLTGYGSLARYRAWVHLGEEGAAERVSRAYRGELRGLGVSVETAEDQAEDFASGFADLSRFLALVGLLALILGGVGVGSAVHVYLHEKHRSMAVLRCLGASGPTLLKSYLIQTLSLGAVGGALGVAGGLALQFALSVLVSPLLPFEIVASLYVESVLVGWGVGVWVAVLFSLPALMRVRDVSPLAALRSDVEPPASAPSTLRLLFATTVFASFFALSWFALGDPEQAFFVTAAMGATLALLGLAAVALVRITRVILPGDAPFPLRQGLAGLFRPGNQTVVVVTALGLGAFMMSALLVVESRLRSEVSMEGRGPDVPSLVLFDIQRDQVEGVRRLLEAEDWYGELVPIVPARLEAVDGETVAEIRAERSNRRRWMYDRLYRNTFRDELGPSERVVEGRWWDDPGRDPDAVLQAVGRGASRVSLERDLAEDLDVGIGDEIVWDVQGIPVSSVVSSLREVEWSSFEPNFFAVFEPGSLEGAPATFVTIASMEDPEARRRVQEALLAGYPNVSFLDISRVQETATRIARQIGMVFRALAGFILAGGTLVLLASLLSTRFTRRTETALLKALGARAATIRGVVLSEYAALGGIGAALGLLFGTLGGHLLLDWQFEMDGTVPWITLAGLWAGILATSVLVGWSVSGPVLRAPALAVIREDPG